MLATSRYSADYVRVLLSHVTRVLPVNPGAPLPPSAQRAASKDVEHWQHLAQRTTLLSQHNPCENPKQNILHQPSLAPPEAGPNNPERLLLITKTRPQVTSDAVAISRLAPLLVFRSRQPPRSAQTLTHSLGVIQFEVLEFMLAACTVRAENTSTVCKRYCRI